MIRQSITRRAIDYTNRAIGRERAPEEQPDYEWDAAYDQSVEDIRGDDFDHARQRMKDGEHA